MPVFIWRLYDDRHCLPYDSCRNRTSILDTHGVFINHGFLTPSIIHTSYRLYHLERQTRGSDGSVSRTKRHTFTLSPTKLARRTVFFILSGIRGISPNLAKLFFIYSNFLVQRLSNYNPWIQSKAVKSQTFLVHKCKSCSNLAVLTIIEEFGGYADIFRIIQDKY